MLLGEISKDSLFALILNLLLQLIFFKANLNTLLNNIFFFINYNNYLIIIKKK
jgi:hypothetical protein